MWALAVRARSVAKRHRVLGPLEAILLKAGPRLIPPPRQEVEVRLQWGMRMTVPPGLPSARSYAMGVYEVDMTKLFQKLVRRGMVVVDAGANVGYYSLLVAHLVGPEGKVFAFEPDPTNYTYLRRNLERNGCANVEAVRRAVSDRTGQDAFVPDPFGVEGHLGDGHSTGASIPVETLRLDDFFAERGWPKVDVVKLDIEGSELRALKGMTALSQRNPSLFLLMEVSKRHMREAGVTDDSLAATLQDLGFRGGHLVEEGFSAFDIERGLPKTSTIEYDILLTKGPPREAS